MNSSREDYIKVIYKLSFENKFTTNKEISEYLDVSKASVSEMVKKLKKESLLNVNKNEINLSKKGAQMAENILSKHRIWEYFLSVELGLEKDEVHKQAEILEHVTNNKLKDALNKYLDYPNSCPHGKIIYENEITFK